jgi:hypothetical protein
MFVLRRVDSIGDNMSLAQDFYEAFFTCSNAEEALDNAILTAFGADPHSPDTWPCGGMTYDWYDNSFELRGTNVDFEFTDAQLAEVWKLGFTHGWICFNDQTEIHVSASARSARKESHHGPENWKREEKRNLCPKCHAQLVPAFKLEGRGNAASHPNES